MVLSYATIHLQQVSAHKAAELQRTVQTLQQVDNNKVELEKNNQQLQQELKTEYVPKEQHETELKQKEQEIERIRLSKAQEKEAEAKRLASIQVQQEQPHVTATVTGSGCEWLKGQLLANGISANDLPAAIYIADAESDCTPCKINGGAIDCGYVGNLACNVFQELPCGKWGGSSGLAAHIRGASTYAANTYGGWWGAYKFWLANKYW